MNYELIGKEVFSKKYGKGKIVGVDENIFVVSFDTFEKTYLYPLAFEKGLSVDEKTKTKALNILNLERQKKEQEALQIELERERILHQYIEFNGGIFKEDYNFQHLQKHPILTYQKVESKFGIKLTGYGKGINISKNEKSIVLISVIAREKNFFVYHDHWTQEGEYIYSGEGKKGNQSLTKGNRAILNSQKDNKTIHLLIKFSPQEYLYQGIFKLVDYTYEDDIGEDKIIRKEYKFRLGKVF